MKKEQFIKLINKLKNLYDIDLYKLGIDLSKYDEKFYDVINILMNDVFNEEQIDWIEWYIYEKGGNPELKAWDKDKNEICYDDESLYEEIKKLKHKHKNKK